MALYLTNPQQLLIGKLTKRMYKSYSPNDRVVVEKNLKSLLDLRLLYCDYCNDDGKTLVNTVASGKDGTIYIIGFKKTHKDDFYKRYLNQYNELQNVKEMFIDSVRNKTKNINVSFFNIKAIFISSVFSPDDIKKSKEFVVPCELYTWSMVENILIFDKIREKYN